MYIVYMYIIYMYMYMYIHDHGCVMNAILEYFALLSCRTSIFRGEAVH